MKRISSFTAIAGAMIAAAWLVSIAPISQRSAQAGPIINLLSGGYYDGYGPGYGAYSGYGYSPYGYGTAPGYVYPSYGGYGRYGGYGGYGPAPSYNRDGYGRGVYYYRGNGGSPYFGQGYHRAYNPYGFGVYSSYGY